MKMENMAVCDLRTIKTAEAAKSIESIENVAMLILPKGAEPDVLSALTAIPKRNIAATFELGENARVEMHNGITHISPGSLSDDEAVCIVNGIVVAEAIPPQKKTELIVNGILLLHEENRKESGIHINTINGLSVYADFDQCITAGDSFELDTEFLKYAKPKTVVVAGDSINITKDVTSDMLAEKIAYLVAGDEITCYKTSSGFVRANSACGDEIVVKGS